MEQDFWNERWEAGRIGFHQPAGHSRLPDLVESMPRGRALVPLAGKTPDIVTLHQKGYDVVAVEFIESAVRAFGEEQSQLGLEAVEGPNGFELRGERLRFVSGDFFGLAADEIGRFDAVYDRAALVALPPADRVRYVQHLRGLLAPAGDVLLLTFEYKPGTLSGPPFSVPPTEVESLYAGASVTAAGSREVPLTSRPGVAPGLITEHAFRISGAAQ